MARATYDAADKARVYVVLQTNEGNVKRTARDTQVPENTVRRWKKEWETNPPEITEEIREAVTNYVEKMEQTADLALDRMYTRLSSDNPKDWGTMPQLATVFGVLRDKIDRARGIGTNHQHEHRLTLPSPDEIRATLGALVAGAQQGHAAREGDIIEIDAVEEQPALPAGN